MDLITIIADIVFILVLADIIYLLLRRFIYFGDLTVKDRIQYLIKKVKKWINHWSS